MSNLILCPERDSNPHALRHTPLKRACLPISAPGPKWSAKMLFFLNQEKPCSLFSDPTIQRSLRITLITPIHKELRSVQYAPSF